MAQDDLSALRQAITAWHEKLLELPATQSLLLGRATARPQERTEAVSAAAEQLSSYLEEHRLPDELVDDVLSVCETFASLCGVELPHCGSGPGAVHGHSGAPLNPAKLKLIKAATGLPVHTTSIGRRASASYCVYESIGGWETLSAAVESLYNRMRNDGRCAVLFFEVNEQSLKTQMLEFLTCALGGKARFASSTLLTSQRDQLRSHGFGVGQFDAMLQHMKAVLDELGVQQETAASAIALLRCHKYLFERRVSEAEAEEEPAPADA